MSPEVLSAPTTGAYSLRADVWSLGMVLYELLTFNRPYHTVPYMLIPSHILSGRRPDLPSLLPSYDFLKEVFMQCTQLDADARPSVERLVSSLVTAIAGDDLLRVQLSASQQAPPPSTTAAKGSTLAAPPAPFVEVNGYALQQKARSFFSFFFPSVNEFIYIALWDRDSLFRLFLMRSRPRMPR